MVSDYDLASGLTMATTFSYTGCYNMKTWTQKAAKSQHQQEFLKEWGKMGIEITASSNMNNELASLGGVLYTKQGAKLLA